MKEIRCVVCQSQSIDESEAGIAYVDEQNRLVIETAGQWLHEDRKQIALMLQLPEDQVIIRYAAIGGAFGGRNEARGSDCSTEKMAVQPSGVAVARAVRHRMRCVYK